MKAKDIRIGNWYNEFGIPKQATAAFILKLCQIELAGKIAIDVSPIELTEEWIIENTVYQEYCANGIDIDIYDSLIILEGEYLMGHDKEDDSWEFVREVTEPFDSSTFLTAISAPMKYVNQLQNYFPAMSGSDLQLISKI